MAHLGNWIAILMKGVIVVSALLIVFIMCAEIALRFVFRNPMSGPEEISVTAVLWLFFVASAYAISKGFHISGGVPVKKASIRRLMEVGYSFFGLLVILVYGYLAFHYSVWVAEHNVATTALRIPYIASMSGVLLGMVLMLGYTVREIVIRLRVLRA